MGNVKVGEHLELGQLIGDLEEDHRIHGEAVVEVVVGGLVPVDHLWVRWCVSGSCVAGRNQGTV